MLTRPLGAITLPTFAQAPVCPTFNTFNNKNNININNKINNNSTFNNKNNIVNNSNKNEDYIFKKNSPFNNKNNIIDNSNKNENYILKKDNTFNNKSNNNTFNNKNNIIININNKKNKNTIRDTIRSKHVFGTLNFDFRPGNVAIKNGTPGAQLPKWDPTTFVLQTFEDVIAKNESQLLSSGSSMPETTFPSRKLEDNKSLSFTGDQFKQYRCHRTE